MKNLNYTSIITPVLLAFAIAGCSAEAEPAKDNNGARERVVPVGIMVVEAIPFEDRLRVSGTVMAMNDALIAAETGGQILFVAERGTTVKKGDLLLRLDDRMLRSGYDAAKTGFQLAEDVFKRQQALYADSVISTVQFLQAKAQRDQAKSQLDVIEKQLGDANLRAPFNGRIEDRFVSAGEVVGPGMPVVRLVNTSQVKVAGGVPERFSASIGEGTAVEINFRSYGLEPRTGIVGFASNLINLDSRTYPVEVVLDNPGEHIKPSMVAEMQVLRERLEDGLVIPRNAIQRDEGGLTVFAVVWTDGRARARTRRVESRLVSGDYVVISSGISPGEEIVVTGFTSLSDGDLLNIVTTVQNRDITGLARN